MDTIELNGLKFRVQVEADDYQRMPWEECDGHGIVDCRRGPGYYGGHFHKAAGERVLYTDRCDFWVYDWAATMVIAKRDGWGLNDADKAKLAAKLGREPAQGEITAESVQRDFDYLRRFLTGDWCYVGVIVTLLDVDGNPTDENESLWGIESDSKEYIEETAQELAEQIANRIGDAAELVRTTKVR